MKYLIAGGFGFIGTSLCEKLLNFGHDVICIDNMITAACRKIPFENEKFLFINGDILQIGSQDILKDIVVDGIFHLASPTDPSKCSKFQTQTFDSNTSGTYKLAEYAKKCNCPLLFTSSVRVLDEGVLNPYLLGKKVGETICKEYGFKIARLGSVYGPNFRKDDNRVVPKFIRLALNNENLEIWFGGKQKDSFCYLDDVVDGLIRFMQSDNNDVFEFGSKEVVTIGELAENIIQISKSKSNIFLVEKGGELPKRKILNISRTIELLNWFPKITLREGLEKIIGEMK